MTATAPTPPFRPGPGFKRLFFPLEPRRAVRRLRRRSRHGISIWGVMLGLVVTGIGISALITMYGSAREGAQHAALNQLIATLRANIERLHAGRSNYAGLTVASLDLAGGVPDSARSNATLAPGAAGIGINHPLGGAIDVNAFGAAATATRYIIQIRDVEQETCAAVLQNWVGQRTGRSGIVGIDTSAAAVTTYTTATVPAAATGNVPLETGDIANECTATNVHVQLYFR